LCGSHYQIVRVETQASLRQAFCDGPATEMGRPVKRHLFKFLCFGIVLLGVALPPLLAPGLSGGSQRGGSPGPIPASPWPPAIRNATIGTLPTMGWNSWNHFACGIDETLIKQIADAM